MGDVDSSDPVDTEGGGGGGPDGAFVDEYFTEILDVFGPLGDTPGGASVVVGDPEENESGRGPDPSPTPLFDAAGPAQPAGLTLFSDTLPSTDSPAPSAPKLVPVDAPSGPIEDWVTAGLKAVARALGIDVDAVGANLTVDPWADYIWENTGFEGGFPTSIPRSLADALAGRSPPEVLPAAAPAPLATPVRAGLLQTELRTGADDFGTDPLGRLSAPFSLISSTSLPLPVDQSYGGFSWGGHDPAFGIPEESGLRPGEGTAQEGPDAGLVTDSPRAQAIRSMDVGTGFLSYPGVQEQLVADVSGATAGFAKQPLLGGR